METRDPEEQLELVEVYATHVLFFFFPKMFWTDFHGNITS